MDDEVARERRELFRTLLGAHLYSIGWAGTGISLRAKSEMCYLPHAANWRSEAAFILPRDRAAFLRFWTAIGGLEMLILTKRYADLDARHAFGYAISKWSLLLLRNVALLRETILTSYHSVHCWARAHCPAFPSAEAYAIKIGARHSNSGMGPLFTAECLAQLMASAELQAHDRDMLRLLHAVSSLRFAHCEPDLFVSIAAENAYTGQLTDIISYEVRKLGTEPSR